VPRAHTMAADELYFSVEMAEEPDYSADIPAGCPECLAAGAVLPGHDHECTVTPAVLLSHSQRSRPVFDGGSWWILGPELEDE
jgi:hypothetical protein